MTVSSDTRTAAPHIGPAADGDYDAVCALLEASNLETDGLSEHMASALVARDAQAGEIVGSAALELYGPYGLLRSVAVDERLRGTGLGQALTRAAIELARQRDLHALYLLTETAGGFFLRFGFRPVARKEVPAEVQQSVEFTVLCPVSALAMALDLHSLSKQ